MYVASTNNPREDSIFSGKVKSVIAACEGSLVPALDDYECRHQAALEGGADGIDYGEFLSYLRDHGVTGLTDFEGNYLCASFDDGVAPKKNNVISAKTFTRHLTGLNYRRMNAVLQAWEVVLEVAGGDNGKQATVPADQLLSTYRRVAGASRAAWGGTDREAKLENTFSADRSSGASVRGPALFTKSRGTEAGTKGAVTRAEFIAFYASVSPQYRSDESFETMMLKEWAADRPQKPKLQSTQRAWGEEGDPLAIEGTHYVHDALNRDLGISSKSYNYTHMTREHPYVEPLAPLDRPDLMQSMTQRTYRPYDENAQTFADPLASRRGQMM